MDVLVYLVAAVIIIALICILSFIKNKNKKAVDDEGGAAVVNAPRREPQPAPVLAGGVRVRNRRGRMQRARDESDEEGEMFGEDEFEHVALPDGKIGAKKMKKLQEKEEKRRNREAELAEREERKEQDKLREEQRKKEENRRAQEDKKNEEEANRLKEEEEAQELEEYLKLKAEFEVHEEGTQEEHFDEDLYAKFEVQEKGMQEEHFDEDGDSLLQRFVNYIQDMKVVMLEDLAGHFKLKTQDCIDRIKNLQDEGRLSGVLDDRGKFIHITKEEYEAVAKFIKQRGRVSITDLAESSNNLINLNPDNQETHKKLVTEVSS